MKELPPAGCGCCGPPKKSPDEPACCGRATIAAELPPQCSGGTAAATAPWIVGKVASSAGDVRQVATALRLGDRLGTWLARWGIGRMHYAIAPGLYAAGRPTADSPVLVSANYKMSFDRLRSELGRLDAWILVIDTRGINVWCAAGKGTFGTDEIVGRVQSTRLADVVAHRTLVLPQLGAPGIAAHEVKRQTGFRVVYGPVRAADLPAYLAAGMKAEPEMRQVHFALADRLAVVPVELVMAAKYVLLAAAAFLLLAGLGRDGYSLARVLGAGLGSAAILVGASAAGVVLTAALLPWLPGRALALKGFWVGLLVLLALLGHAWYHTGTFDSWFTVAGWCLLIPAIVSFFAMNFTGATTYTSLSGVQKEMALAVPLQAIASAAGVVLWMVGRFF